MMLMRMGAPQRPPGNDRVGLVSIRENDWPCPRSDDVAAEPLTRVHETFNDDQRMYHDMPLDTLCYHAEGERESVGRTG
jgi:hypothetical protein